MAIDAYEPCVCGSNKKVKFCCSKDIAGELDKVMSAVNSDQRVAAIEQINRLIQSHGDRDCLLVTKASILIQLKQYDAAQEIVDALLEKNPENALVLAQAAVLAMRDGDVDVAVVLLQNALDQIDQVMPSTIIEVTRMIGIGLLMEGRIQAARTHLGMYQQLVQKEDPEVMNALMRTYASTELPLLLKEDHPVAQAPEGVAWGDEMKKVVEIAEKGRFRSAIEGLRELEASSPNEPVIRRNIAILESRLGDMPAMVDAWRTYSRTDGVELDNSIEAEAMAQLLDDDPDREFAEVVAVTFNIDRQADAMEKMLVHELFEYSQQPPRREESQDAPPPKAIFTLLDKPIPGEDVTLTLDMVPEIIADIHLFGKETDREARLVVTLFKNEHFEKRLDMIREELSEFIGEKVDEEVIERFTKQSVLLSWRWRLPTGTSNEVRDALAFEKHEEVMMKVWPDLPLDVLDGKTPREAASEDEYRVPLLAAILLLEETGDHRLTARLDINRLRSDLGLPTADSIDPTETNIRELSLPRFTRAQFDKLGDEELIFSLRKSMINGLPGVMKRVLELIIDRETITDDLFERSQAHGMLARLAETQGEALELIGKAQQMAVEKGQSPAPHLIAELEIRIERGAIDGVQALMRRIEQDHIREPGVAQEVANVLARFGLLDPNAAGMPPGAAPAPPAAAPGGESIQSSIWTPETERPSTPASPPTPPAQEDGPSKLWLPGMD